VTCDTIIVNRHVEVLQADPWSDAKHGRYLCFSASTGAQCAASWFAGARVFLFADGSKCWRSITTGNTIT
jgi:hypothetical protein